MYKLFSKFSISKQIKFLIIFLIVFFSINIFGFNNIEANFDNFKISYEHKIDEDVDQELIDDIVYKNINEVESVNQDTKYILVYQENKFYFYASIISIICIIILICSILFYLYKIIKNNQKLDIIIILIDILLLFVMFKNIYFVNKNINIYDKVYEIKSSDKLPETTKIKGYKYLGYIKEVVLENNTTTNNALKEEKTSEIKNVDTHNTKTNTTYNDRVGNVNNTQRANINPVSNTNTVEIENQTSNIKVSIIEKEIIIPYQDLAVIYKTDPNLESGNKREVVGKNGKTIIKYEVSYLNDKELSRKEIERNTIDAIASVVFLGTKTDNQSPNPIPPVSPNEEIRTREEFVDIPFDVENLSDVNLLVGSERKEEGEKGQVKKIYEDTYVDGVLKSSKLIEEVIIKNPKNEIIYTGSKLKTKPIITISNVVKNASKNQIIVNYNLSDIDSAYVLAKARIYHNDEIIKEVEIPTLSTEAIDENFVINDIPLDIDYTLKTYLTYDLGEGNSNSLEESVYDFILEDKSVEIKRITGISLYNGDEKIVNLKTIPNDFSSFVTKISSENMNDIVLQVKNIEEVEMNGKIVFKITASSPELVQDREEGYGDDHIFYMPKNIEKPGVYNDFSELIKAIRENPSGEFILGADLVANEKDLEVEENNVKTKLDYYFDGVFSGRLIGQDGENKFTIYDLKAPLFKEMTNGSVKNIDFKQVDINSKVAYIATVAGVLTNSTVEDVSVSGRIEGPGNIGGVVGRITQNSVLRNVSYQGEIILNDNIPNYTGGIVGSANTNSLIEKAKVDVSMTGALTNQERRMGGIVGGMISGARINQAYVKGSIVNKTISNAQVGGVAGTLYVGGVIRNVVMLAKVENGHKIYGDTNDKTANVKDAYYVDGVSFGKDDTLNNKPVSLSFEEAQTKIESYNITTDINDSNFDHKIIETDYTNIKDYDPAKDFIYKNIEKLLPYYNKATIVKYGNKVLNSDNIANKTIKNIILLKDKEPVYELSKNKESANGIMMVYDDGSIEIRDITYLEGFKDTLIQEYQINGTNLIYTPQTLAKEYGSELDDLVNELVSLEYMDVVKHVRPDYKYYFYQLLSHSIGLGLKPDNSSENIEVANQSLKAHNVDPYYLKNAFDNNKANLRKHLIAMIENDLLNDTTNKVNPSQVIKRIKENKEKILLGLAYMTRWYNVDFNGVNIADYTIYHQDIFGNKHNAIEFLKQIGSIPIPSDSKKINEDLLMSFNTAKAYKKYLAPITNKANIGDYLIFFKDIFAPEMTINDWFKNTTKAIIHEEKPSLPELNHVDVSAWTIFNKNEYNSKMILPLLTMRHRGVAISITMTTLIFSPFEKYFKVPEVGNYDNDFEIINGMKKLLENTAKQMSLNAEMWYRILPEPKKHEMYNLNMTPIVTFDGFNVLDEKGKKWMIVTEENEAPKNESEVVYANSTVKDFFAPVGEWRKNNRTSAYADGTFIWYMSNTLMVKKGISIMTHEIVHNMDGRTYFLGYGRRLGMGMEDFATGMLQSIENADTDETFGINTDTDYHTYLDGSLLNKLIHNSTPERFTDAQALKEYLRGTYDVIYTLNYAEAEEMLKLSKNDLRYLINKVERKDEILNDGTISPHSKEVYRRFNDDEWDVLEFRTIEDLIDNQVVVGRINKNGKQIEVGRNTYNTDNRFLARYGSYTTEKGSPGSQSFKHNSFEILAEAGYDGYINYVSNKLNKEAVSEGKVLSDAYILQKTFDNRYQTYNDFRKSMYANRYAKKDSLKPFVYLGVTYNTYEDLKNLMAKAIQEDLKAAKNGNFEGKNVKNLKKEIFRYYLHSTNEFRNSIYSE